MTDSLPTPSQSGLSRAVHEIIDFVDAEGWDRPPSVFALVPTALLAASEPSLGDRLDEGSEYTPVLQESLPDDVEGGSPALAEFLSTLVWPEAVAGCALVQEIVVLPPGSASDLDDADDEPAPLLSDRHSADEAEREAALTHPDRRDARLLTAVLRDGPSMSLLELRPTDDDPFAGAELRTYEGLGSNVVDALYVTFDNEPD